MKALEIGKFKINPLYILIILVLLAVVYVAVGYAEGPSVQAGDTVQVNYVGTFPNGTVFDSSQGRGPLNFTVGSGQVITGFDSAVVGMKLNQEKTVTLQPSEAYGEVNPDLIVSIPANSFGNQTLPVGTHVARNVPGGQQHGVITAVSKTNITIDFNPPLAGKTLIFKITVVGIEKAK